ncbi:hypothetical protein T10_13008 [Trichinella papuae]|uniref:Uncharacterized protein n=1 Tax=Trichinella papuae TaxID=268474 RepID=A0A0V1MBH0_9BILA|nr:hypothetical protein T10_13008 [Trichinella papuae]
MDVKAIFNISTSKESNQHLKQYECLVMYLMFIIRCQDFLLFFILKMMISVDVVYIFVRSY